MISGWQATKTVIAMARLQKWTDEAGKADRLTLKLWLRLLEGKGLSKHKWAVD